MRAPDRSRLVNLHLGVSQSPAGSIGSVDAVCPSSRVSAITIRPSAAGDASLHWVLDVRRRARAIGLSSVSNRLGLTIELLVLLAGVASIFLSLRRLNRQMVAAKQRAVASARHLYAQTLEPVRQERTLQALRCQPASLSAAEALEKRAKRIRKWPFDEGTFARVVTISSTAFAAILVRVLLAPFGI